MSAAPRVRIVIPVFNDWTAASRVLQELDTTLASSGRAADVLLVDDGSFEPAPASPVAARAGGIAAVDVLRLRRNLGHQRAIAIALAYLEATAAPDLVVVMDGDGEDRPSDVPRLLAAADSGDAVVFAERRRRSEGVLFTTLYHGYRIVHWLFTGERVRVGNFSVIPRAALARLVAVSDLWNHYAAAVFKSRIPFSTIPTERGIRYAGKTQMNYVALVTHGLSAMAAFGDRIGVRLLTLTIAITAIVTGGLIGSVARLWISGAVMPSWAPFAIALIVLLVVQAFAVSLTFVFVILGGRDSSTFLPLRDYQYYVLDCVPLASLQNERIPVRR